MKHKFVMDENTVVCALTLEDEHGSEDFTCAQLWLNIARNCHSIVVNDQLLRGYYQMVQKIQRPGFKIIRVINQITKVASKTQFLAYSPKHDWAPTVPADDVPIVALAVQSSAVLVTSDSRLRDNLRSSKDAQINSLRVLSPEEASSLALAT